MFFITFRISTTGLMFDFLSNPQRKCATFFKIHRTAVSVPDRGRKKASKATNQRTSLAVKAQCRYDIF